MNKAVKICAVLALCTALAGCGINTDTQQSEGEETGYLQNEQTAGKWGITLSVKDASPSGLTLVITQSGGDATGELEYGSDYIIEKYNGETWEKVPYAVNENNVAFTAEAYIVPTDSIAEIDITWENLYGSLPAGRYRIAKSFTDFRGTGDYDTQNLYAEFIIE